jgi:integrase
MPPRYQALLHLAAWDGLRLGEALALRRGDVDVDDDTITVRRTLTIVESRLRTGPPKSAAGLRTVHSPAHVAAILAAHMARWTGPHPDDPVFTNTRGDPLRAGPLYKAFWRARAQVDLPELHWHDLRHAAATYAAQTGASLAELQARIGHSTAAAALRYQHAATGRDQILAHNLEQLHTTRSARQASDAS